MKRPNQQQTRKPHTDEELRKLAKRALYVGSPEHKNKQWWGGLPEVPCDKNGNPKRPKKQKTTICPIVTSEGRDQATAWIRTAIETKQFKFVEGDQDFPKHIWLEVEGQYWFGFCVNPTAGHYKGWPLEESEYRALRN